LLDSLLQENRIISYVGRIDESEKGTYKS